MSIFRKLFASKPGPQPVAEPETPEQIAERLTATAVNDLRPCEQRVHAVREIAARRPADALARLIAVFREGSYPLDLKTVLEESITALDPRALQEHRKRSSELASVDRELLEELRRCGQPDVLNVDEVLEQVGGRLRAAGGKGAFTLAFHIEELIPRRSREILAALYLARHAELTYDLTLTLKSLRYSAQYRARPASSHTEIVAGDRGGWSDPTYLRIRELTEEALSAGQQS